MYVEKKSDEDNRKIARSEWPAIALRFANGESLASIGRSYGCSAPAVRYIVLKQAPEAYAAVLERRRRPGRAPSADRAAELVATSRADDAMREGPPVENDGFDRELRQQMKIDLSAFLLAFDAVVAGGTSEDFQRLRECTDRLLHVAAWTRIELERVEKQRGAHRARVPDAEKPSRKARQ
jgi:hypothetical protein